MKISDGKKTIDIEIREWKGTSWGPDFSNDYFDAGALKYDADNETYIVDDVDYCIDFATDLDSDESAIYGNYNVHVFVDDVEVKIERSEKMVYIVEQANYTPKTGYGDSWQLVYTFDLDKARKESAYYYHHLTKFEKAKTETAIRGYNVLCREGKTAKESFEECTNNIFVYPDADFVEIYSESDDEDT